MISFVFVNVENAMIILGGYSVEKRSQRAVHVSNADDLLLNIPSLLRPTGGFGGKCSDRKSVSRLVISYLQSEMLTTKPSGYTADRESNELLLDSPRLFRGFLKRDINIIAHKVRLNTK